MLPSLKAIVEVVRLDPQGRVQRRVTEQIVAVPEPLNLEDNVEAVRLMPHEHICEIIRERPQGWHCRDRARIRAVPLERVTDRTVEQIGVVGDGAEGSPVVAKSAGEVRPPGNADPLVRRAVERLLDMEREPAVRCLERLRKPTEQVEKEGSPS